MPFFTLKQPVFALIVDFHEPLKPHLLKKNCYIRVKILRSDARKADVLSSLPKQWYRLLDQGEPVFFNPISCRVGFVLRFVLGLPVDKTKHKGSSGLNGVATRWS